jgi:hypothetical protein
MTSVGENRRADLGGATENVVFFTPTIIFGGLPYAVKNTDIFDNFSGPLKI